MNGRTDIAPQPGVASLLSALAHPQRLRIFAELANGGRQYVSELARRLQMNRPLLHMHLKRLETAGAVVGTLELSADGRAVRFYAVAPFDVRLTPATVAAAACEISESTTTRAVRKVQP